MIHRLRHKISPNFREFIRSLDIIFHGWRIARFRRVCESVVAIESCDHFFEYSQVSLSYFRLETKAEFKWVNSRCPLRVTVDPLIDQWSQYAVFIKKRSVMRSLKIMINLCFGVKWWSWNDSTTPKAWIALPSFDLCDWFFFLFSKIKLFQFIHLN